MTPEEAGNRRNIKKAQKQIEKEFERVIDEAFKGSLNLKFTNQTFKLSENPAFQNKLEKALENFRVRVELILVNGISAGFDLSAQNFEAVVYRAFDGRTIIPAVKEILESKLEPVLNAFKARRVNGLPLSQRVWDLSRQFQGEIEQTLFAGLSELKSAQEIARDVKKYLKHPDKLFRRVRNAKGNLVLSQPAREFKPGQGVYRSSYKNAMRLSRTEINTAYRTADHARFESTPFVLGVEIRLSLAHPRFDICDYLVGIYPANFKFTGFHIQCLCFAVPILPSRDEFDRYQRAVLDGKGESFDFAGKVREIPQNALDWVEENREQISRWKSPPTFISDNPGKFNLGKK